MYKLDRIIRFIASLIITNLLYDSYYLIRPSLWGYKYFFFIQAQKKALEKLLSHMFPTLFQIWEQWKYWKSMAGKKNWIILSDFSILNSWLEESKVRVKMQAERMYFLRRKTAIDWVEIILEGAKLTLESYYTYCLLRNFL